MRATNLFWSFHWTYGKLPIVCFSNSKVSANVIYSLEDIEKMLDQKPDNIRQSCSVPYNMLQFAYEEFKAGNIALCA